MKEKRMHDLSEVGYLRFKVKVVGSACLIVGLVIGWVIGLEMMNRQWAKEWHQFKAVLDERISK